MSNFLEQTYIKTYSSFYINSFEPNVFHYMEIYKFPILFIKEVIIHE